MLIVLKAPSHQSELFCSVTSCVILYIIGLILLFSSRFSTTSHHNKARPQSVWIYQFRCILLAPLSQWLLVVTSCSLQEHPDAVFVKVRSNNGGQKRGGGGVTFFFCTNWSLSSDVAPAAKKRHKMESQLATASGRAGGGAETASGSIRLTSSSPSAFSSITPSH